ncbi:hypothetical protein [Lysobacter gummosus]
MGIRDSRFGKGGTPGFGKGSALPNPESRITNPRAGVSRRDSSAVL